MKRRDILRNTVAVSAALSLPAWIRTAFAEEPDIKEPGSAALDLALAAARRNGRPLLVFVIPSDTSQRRTSGRVFGELLNTKNDPDLAPLSLVEVVCALVRDMRLLVRDMPDKEPLAVLIETDGVRHARSSTDVTMIPVLPLLEQGLFPSSQFYGESSATVSARIVLLGEIFRSAIAGTPALVGRRVAQARTRISPQDLETFERGLKAGEDPPPSMMDVSAAIAWDAWSRMTGTTATELESALAAAVRRRLTNQRIPGSKWAVSPACGTRVEGEVSHGLMKCGTGSVPEASARFLFFYTVDDSPR